MEVLIYGVYIFEKSWKLCYEWVKIKTIASLCGKKKKKVIRSKVFQMETLVNN